MENSEMDNLRKPWESNEMWNLRRAFLERHWSDKAMTRNRLICLSQIFVNMEYLGCRYDEGLMAKVADMSEGLVEERRQQRQVVAEQLFVKGGRTFAKKASDKPPAKKRKQDADDETTTKKTARDFNAAVVVTTTHPVCAVKMKVLQALKAELMVMQQQRMPNDSLTILNQATNRAKCRWRIQFNDEKHACYLQVDDVLVVEQVYWGSQTRSRTEACRRAVEVLQRPFFDVRQVSEKTIVPTADLDMELFTRREAKGEWESPSVSRCEPLEQAFVALRKRLAALSQENRTKNAAKVLEESAKSEDLPVELKRQHMGGWKEEIIVIVGKVELCRNQGRIPPKGKEQESADECYVKAVDFLMKPTFGDGISITDENGVLAISPKQKTMDKPTVSAPAASATIRRPSRSGDQGSDLARKELSLKSVRLHLNATSDSMNPIQRIEQSCTKAKVPYEVEFAPDTSFSASVTIDGVRIAEASDANKKGAKNKACHESILQLLLPYIRIKQGDGDELVLEASQEPFDGSV